MSRKRIKQYLMLLITAGIVAVVAQGSGTFASFNAEVSNKGNTFQTGSLVLSNAINSGSACYSSEDSANVNTACGAIFTVPNWQPGTTANTQQLTLSNTGSVAASALSFWAPKVATDGTDDTSTGKVCNFETYTPSGDTTPSGKRAITQSDPCAAVEMQIQEYNSDFSTADASCVWPVDGSNACGTNYATLSSLPDSGTPQTVAGGLASGASRYFEITVKYPDPNGSADNAFQAEKMFFNLTWHIDQ